MNWYFTTILTLFIFVGTLHSQSFEGTVDLQVTNEKSGEVSTMVWHKQDINSRLDVSTVSPQVSYSMSLLMEDGSDKLTMLVDVNGKKSAYESAVSKVESKDEPMVDENEVEEGESEEKNGFACDVITVKGENGFVKYWLTKDIDIKLTDFPPLLRQANYYQYLVDFRPGVIPVLILSHNAGGELEFTQEIKQVTAKKVDSAVFQIPADYKQVGN